MPATDTGTDDVGRVNGGAPDCAGPIGAGVGGGMGRFRGGVAVIDGVLVEVAGGVGLEVGVFVGTGTA